MWRSCSLLLVCLSACASAPAPQPQEHVALAPRARPALPSALVMKPAAPSDAVRLALPGGMKVLVIERPRSPVVSVRLVFDAGSAGERSTHAGMTNLAFALLGEGRELDAARKPIIGEKTLRRQVAELGGNYQWSVTPDAATLGIDGYTVDLETYLTQLADAVTRPRAGEQAFENYRSAFRDALEDLETSDGEPLARVLAQAAFGSGHPYAQPVMGTVTSLSELSYDEVVEQQKRLLSPTHATLVVAGDVTAQRVGTLALRAFAGWRAPGGRDPAVRVIPPEATRGPPVRIISRTPAATTLVCGARPLGDLPLGEAAVDVLTYILGDGVSSRLAVLREVHGWSYSPGATLIRRKYGRSILMCARVEASATVGALGVFMATLASARTSSVSPELVEEAKAVLTARALAGRDEVRGAMRDTLAKLIFGSSPEEDATRLRAVTAERVRAVAARVLDPSQLNLILLGPPSVTQQAAREYGVGPVKVVRMADVGGVVEALASQSGDTARRRAARDPLDGHGDTFDIRDAGVEREFMRVVLRVSDRTLDDALSDTYTVANNGESLGPPHLLQVIRTSGQPPVYVLLFKARTYPPTHIIVSRGSGGETAAFWFPSR